MGSAGGQRWWRRPWAEPRIWILLMVVALFLPWCVDTFPGVDLPNGVSVAPLSPAPALVQLVRDAYRNGPGVFVLFGVTAVIALALAVAAFVAASLGRTWGALAATGGYTFAMPSLVLLVAAANRLRVTYLDVTPLAVSVLLAVPAFVLLAHDALREAPEPARRPLRSWLLLVYGGLSGLEAVVWTALAVGAIYHVSTGLADRTSPQPVIFVAALANIAYPLIAVGGGYGIARLAQPRRPPSSLRANLHRPA